MSVWHMILRWFHVRPGAPPPGTRTPPYYRSEADMRQIERRVEYLERRAGITDRGSDRYLEAEIEMLRDEQAARHRDQGKRT